MQRKKSKTKLFKSDRTREWATDFFIGVGLFVLIAFFASTHTDSALPAPLEKTKMALEKSLPGPAVDKNRFVGVPREALLQISTTRDAILANKGKPVPGNRLMIVMALVFSLLVTFMIHFWRNLRREYASPRRKRGRG